MAEPTDRAAREAALEFVRTHRERYLWFLRADYEPRDAAGLIRAIRRIERHGSRDTYVEARRLREWLSRDSSAGSVDS